MKILTPHEFINVRNRIWLDKNKKMARRERIIELKETFIAFFDLKRIQRSLKKGKCESIAIRTFYANSYGREFLIERLEKFKWKPIFENTFQPDGPM